jgi:5-formyltetrahydrofolate cyclo-ligase
MDELLEAKRTVRERALDARLSLAGDERAGKSSLICSAIEGILEYANASAILFYMPVRGEADILPLLRKALAEGRTCALPKCAPGRSLRLFSVTSLESDLAPGRWGIPEPVEGRAREYTGRHFSVIMVPGVAFDRRGSRIGYGAGYYDRLLAARCGGSLKIAPAFAMQVLPELPRGPMDGSVDVIVTEEEIIDCRKAGGELHG